MKTQEDLVSNLSKQLQNWYRRNTTTQLHDSIKIRSRGNPHIYLVGSPYNPEDHVFDEEVVELAPLGALGRIVSIPRYIEHLFQHPENRVLIRWCNEDPYPITMWSIEK